MGVILLFLPTNMFTYVNLAICSLNLLSGREDDKVKVKKIYIELYICHLCNIFLFRDYSFYNKI
jgi:hypothetical protein